jgi:hypothetical protein
MSDDERTVAQKRGEAFTWEATVRATRGMLHVLASQPTER